jgi:hypothetical protein
MKKLFTTMVVALVMVAIPSQAQVKFGLTGGLNMTNMSMDVTGMKEDVKNNAGFFIGPTVNFTLPVIGLGIDASALYDQRSAKNDGKEIKSQSIQIPVNLRYGIGLGSLATVFAFAGPQFGFNLGDKNQTLEDTAGKVKEWRLKSSNMSLNLGLGAMLLGHLQAKINYNIAMGKTGDFKDFTVVDGVKTVSDVLGSAKANSWQISLAYFF